VSNGVVLTGLNGENPLAFLAALGTLRLLQLAYPENRELRMEWVRRGTWRPMVTGVALSEEEMCQTLATAPPVPTEELSSLGKNITVAPQDYQRFAKRARNTATRSDRRTADFAAALGNEVCCDERWGRIQYTDFCFITGSGHQDFVSTAEKLREKGAEQFKVALFEEWRYLDKGLSFGWDPAEGREYALRWSNPGPEGVWTVWGANRLAVESLPFFPAFPTGKTLATTAFTALGSRQAKVFTWPIWDAPLGCNVIRSLLALKALTRESKRFTERNGCESDQGQTSRCGSGRRTQLEGMKMPAG
jgi:hypothetical protein